MVVPPTPNDLSTLLVTSLSCFAVQDHQNPKEIKSIWLFPLPRTTSQRYLLPVYLALHYDGLFQDHICHT